MKCYNVLCFVITLDIMRNMDVVEMLRRIMADAGWSQERLARELGVPFVTVNRWLRRRAMPRRANVEAIERLYLSIVGGGVMDEAAFQELEREALACRLSVGELVRNERLLRSFTIYSTYHTDAIEGSTMTYADVEKVLSDNNRVLANKTAREQFEARNHRAALYFLLDELNDRGEDFTWTVDLILNVHLRLMNAIISNAGRLREHGVMILGSRVVLTEAEEVPGRLEEMVRLLNEESEDFFGQLARTHADFEQIHPFSDGNGRVGRLILVVQALKEGIMPPLVLKERKKVYHKYLEVAQREGDYEALKKFLVECVVTAKEVLEGGEKVV